MKKSPFKIVILIIGFIFFVFSIWFLNAFFGNPISKMLATNTAKEYLATTYGDTDYYMEDIRYSFKDGNYHAFIKSPTSIDTEFTLMLTMFGKLRVDTYEDVLSGFNTANRIESEYRELTDTVFDSPRFPYNCHISFGTLEIYPNELIENPEIDDIPAYSINQDELILDKIYDIRKLGKQAGHLIIYVESDIVTAERAVEIMLDIKKQFDSAKIPFFAMDFTLQYPRPEEGKRPEGEVSVKDFSYADINEAGMLDKVIEADKALKEYYKEQDLKKNSMREIN